VATETVSVSTSIKAPAETIFAVIVDPAKHAAIDGTGWVSDPLDRQLLSASGQIFRMAMSRPGHPNGNYETANRVEAFDPPHAISWKPGYDAGDGKLRFGGWIWRYDLAPLGPFETDVRLFYDWSAVPQVVRITGPNFPPLSRSSGQFVDSPRRSGRCLSAATRREPCHDRATDPGSCSIQYARPSNRAHLAPVPR
jgi:hypothetical protein